MKMTIMYEFFEKILFAVITPKLLKYTDTNKNFNRIIFLCLVFMVTSATPIDLIFSIRPPTEDRTLSVKPPVDPTKAEYNIVPQLDECEGYMKYDNTIPGYRFYYNDYDKGYFIYYCDKKIVEYYIYSSFIDYAFYHCNNKGAPNDQGFYEMSDNGLNGYSYNCSSGRYYFQS